MAATTGIDLGPDSCVLVGVRPAGPVLDVSAVHVIEPAGWPSHDVALAETLKAARRGKRFPRSARVIVWGMPEPLSPDDFVVRAALRPLTAAGFRIDAVLSPAQALVRLAATRPRTPKGSTFLWLAINTHGAAIAVVRDDCALFSRTVDWTYRSLEVGTKAELLQRYSLVAHLAPEIRQAIATVRSMHGAIVEAAITCGDLPDLRSLTMPLIEELDIEVETLDSPAGLRPRGRAKDSRFSELVPSIRLACAAATAPTQRKRPLVALLRAAAVIACGVGIGLVGYAYWSGALGDSTARTATMPVNKSTASSQPKRSPTVSQRAGVRGGMPPAAAPQPPVQPPEKGDSHTSERKSVPVPFSAPPVVKVPPPPATSAPKSAPVPLPEPAARAPVQTTRAEPPPKPPVEAPKTEPVVKPPVEATKAEPTSKPPVQVARSEPPPVIAKPQADPMRPPAAVSAEPVRPAADRAVEVAPPAAPRARPQPPLKDRLPRVDSILIDEDRRLAIIDGRILGVGDAVGQRIVARIEARFVILREPSGLAIRVALGSGSGILPQ
ncbi:MAG: hypothetical protein A3H96_16435 [Acidobacteria bacterium RIFCSPLOWO2_02_FULL_67_36]|nr:MAG: hypothetical protein A3H96_16435 [Acidobacteria bacterium RIFCSPLOWO2_02_FULL_67_36]OFW20752.1 MAG: hypothetical protein A3G21_22635 [Acidobacteria bacterium RIFCSPLOWO2_12_FULL_66_21]